MADVDVDRNVWSDDADDSSLLRAYTDRGDERAFRSLVQRHIDLVYAAACRQAGSGSRLADDIVQAVFVVLATRAKSVRSGLALPAWLLKTTHNVARATLRAETRRRKHERKAARELMATRSTTNGHAARGDGLATGPKGVGFESGDEDGHLIAPLLDDALMRLGERDRLLVTLRYLQGMSFGSIAAATGVSEAAAQKRIARAVAKMRASFARRGVTLSVAAVGEALSRATADAAPAPASLADAACRAGLAARTGLSFGPFAVLHRMLPGHLFGHQFVGMIVAVVLLIAASLAAAAFITRTQSGGTSTPSNVGAAPLPKIRVGVLLSEFTANGWSDNGAWDLSHQKTIVFLRKQPAPDLDVYAILEPGENAKMSKQARRYVPANHIVVANTAADLRRFDVLVAGHTWHLHPQTVAAIDDAVRRGGVGFVMQSGFAMFTPSFTRQVCDLSGVSRGDHFFNKKYACRVTAPHPLLEGLDIGVGATVNADGLCGVTGPLLPGVTPLIIATGAPNDAPKVRTEFIARQLGRAPVPTAAASTAAQPSADVFPLLYIMDHGAGRVVACQWHNKTPLELEPEQDGTFFARCIRWCARRPVQ